MTFLENKKTSSSGQTAIELAIFGAILLFVLGMIVKTNLGYGLNQNNSLRATRMALTASYLSSSVGDCNAAGGNAAGNGTAGKYNIPCVENGARSSASVLFIEDRIMPEMSNKYGGLDRTPLIVQGSGTFTPNLYMPVSDNVPCQWTSAPMCHISNGSIGGAFVPNTTINNVNPDPIFNGMGIPRMDLFINGKHFPFTMAGFSNRYIGTEGVVSCERAVLWDPWCVSKTKNDEDGRGCLKLLKKTTNHRANGRWCDHVGDVNTDPDSIRNCELTHGSLNGEDASHYNNLPLAYRFDLDQSWYHDNNASFPSGGTSANCPADPDVEDPSAGTLVNYTNFAWQWRYVLAVNLDAKKMANGKYQIKDGLEGMSVDSGVNTNVDIDLDGKEERIYGQDSDKRGNITTVWYMDYQMGDMDLTYDTYDQIHGTGIPPGLGKEMKLISRARDGTYLRIEEGKLFTWDPTQQYVRQIQKKDKVDVIEREIQLSNSTGRFCGTGIDVIGPVYTAPVTPKYVDGSPNPVEICCASGYGCSDVNGPIGANTCMSTANSANVRTCMDVVTKIIYVRTNIADLGGRKWVTKVPDDR